MKKIFVLSTLFAALCASAQTTHEPTGAVGSADERVFSVGEQSVAVDE